MDSRSLKLLKAVLNGEIKNLTYNLLQNYKVTKDIVLQHVKRKINLESKMLTKSPQFNSSSTDLKKMSFTQQYEETLSLAPFLSTTLVAAAKNPKINRNTSKTFERIIPGLMTALGTLLFCRNTHCNRIPTLVGIILKRSLADKVCINHLNSFYMSLSYSSVIKTQEELGKDFMRTPNEWSEECLKDGKKLIKEIRSVDALEKHIPVVTEDLSKPNFCGQFKIIYYSSL